MAIDYEKWVKDAKEEAKEEKRKRLKKEGEKLLDERKKSKEKIKVKPNIRGSQEYKKGSTKVRASHLETSKAAQAAQGVGRGLFSALEGSESNKKYGKAAEAVLRDSKAYKYGEMAGEAAGFMVPYGGVTKALKGTKGIVKAGAALEKLGVKEGVAKSVTSGAAADLILSVPSNVNHAFNIEGLSGLEAANDIAQNTAVDIALGIGTEGLGAAGRFIKNKAKLHKEAKEAAANALKGTTTDRTVKRPPKRRGVSSTQDPDAVEIPAGSPSKGSAKMPPKLSEDMGAVATNRENLMHLVDKPDVNKSTISVKPTHTPEQIGMINDYKNAVDEDVYNFVKRVYRLNDKNVASKLNLDLGNVSNRTKEDVSRILGVDINGYTHNMNGSSVSHIEKRHGVNGKRDSSMKNVEDVSRIKYVLENYDDVDLLLKDNGENETFKEWTNSDQTPSHGVKFSKKIDGMYYVVEAVPDSGNKKLQIISAYIEEKKERAPRLLNMDKTPQHTSETLDASTLSTNRVADSGGNVKGASQHDIDTPTYMLRKPPKRIDSVSGNEIGADRNRYGYDEMTSKFRTNTVENSQMFDGAREQLKDDGFKYRKVSERESVETARQRLQTDYRGEEENLFKKEVFDGSDTDTAMQILSDKMDAAKKTGDYNDVRQWAKQISAKGTEMGQGIQAFAKYSRHTARGKVVEATKAVERSIADLEAGNPKKLDMANEYANTVSKAISDAGAGAAKEAAASVSERLEKAVTKAAGKQLYNVKTIVNKTLRDMRIDLSKVARSSSKDKKAAMEKVGDHVRDNLISSGISVSEYDIDNIVNLAKKEFTDQLDSRARGILEARFKPRRSVDRKRVLDDVMELINMGAYNDDAILNLMRKHSGIPILSDKNISDIMRYMKQAENAETDLERRQFESMAENIITSLETKTKTEQFRALQRISMLLLPKTWGSKNMGGNAALSFAENIKDIPASMLDRLISLKTGKRTTTGLSLDKLKAQASGAKQGLGEWASDIRASSDEYGKGKWYKVDTSQSRTKYEMAPGESFKDKGIGKPLNFLEGTVGKLLQLGDRPFYQSAYNSRIAELKKLGIEGEEAAEDATKYALERVFQNETSFSRGANRLRQSLNEMFGGFPVGNIVIPFTQTPANIFVKALEYSPAGFIRALGHLGKGISKGTFDQKKFVDMMGRALTGTGICCVAWNFAKNGILIPDTYDPDNEELTEAERLSGKQSYSLHIGDNYYTVDWAEPLGTLFSATADFYEAGGKEEDLVSMLTAGFEGGVNSIFSKSFLTGLSNMLKGYNPAVGIGSALLGSTSQAIPSPVRALAKSIDPYSRETYDPNKIKQQGNKLLSGLPGLSYLLPVKKDVRGEDVLNNQGRGTAARFYENFISPYNISQEMNDPVNNELLRLRNATGENGVLLKKADKKITYNHTDYTLLPQEYVKFQETMGKEAYSRISELINSGKYAEMSDEQKARAISDINSAAREKAKFEFIAKRTGDNSVYLDKKDVIVMDAGLKDKYARVKDQYTEEQFRAEYDKVMSTVDAAGGSQKGVKAMAMAENGIDSGLYKVILGERSKEYKHTPLDKAAQKLYENGWSAKDIASICEKANINKDSSISIKEAKRYLDACGYDRRTKFYLFSLVCTNVTEKNNPYR